MTYFLAVGCSHTAGVGVEPDKIYVDFVSRYFDIECVNLAKNGGNSNQCLRDIVKTLKQNNNPSFIVAQWPNIFRKTLYNSNGSWFENVANAGEVFKKLLHLGEENFIQPWLFDIVLANIICQSAKIPIYNICLEEYDSFIVDKLSSDNIQLHMDEKITGKSWIFDNAGLDKIHHSAICHKSWAERLIGIINENTAR